MGKVVMYSTVSVDGFIADEQDQPFHFVDGVEAAMAKAQELAGDRTVEVAMDVAPVVLGSASAASGPSTHSTCWRTPTW